MLKTLIIATAALALGATGAMAGGKHKHQGAYYPHQQMNEQGQAIMPPKNYDGMRSNGTFIVDEYGRHYNERGDRIR